MKTPLALCDSLETPDGLWVLAFQEAPGSSLSLPLQSVRIEAVRPAPHRSWQSRWFTPALPLVSAKLALLPPAQVGGERSLDAPLILLVVSSFDAHYERSEQEVLAFTLDGVECAAWGLERTAFA
jgi:hypothetical protein